MGKVPVIRLGEIEQWVSEKPTISKMETQNGLAQATIPSLLFWNHLFFIYLIISCYAF